MAKAKMDYHVMAAEFVSGYVLSLRFRDVTAGEFDLERELVSPVFEALRDPEVFKQFRIHPEFHTMVWPNAPDIAPEFLHGNVRVII